jgi:hypothetical protein
VPTIECVAQPVGGDCTHCASLTGGNREVQIRFARGTSPTESLGATADLADVHWLNPEPAALVHWRTVDETADTLRLNSALAPIVPAVAAARTAAPVTTLHVPGISAQPFEPLESLGTMSETLGVQPPAPIATLPAAAGSVPALLLPVAGQR